MTDDRRKEERRKQSVSVIIERRNRERRRLEAERLQAFVDAIKPNYAITHTGQIIVEQRDDQT